MTIPMHAPAAQAERPEVYLVASVLAALGIGLALGAGLTLTVSGTAGAGGGLLAALALGPVALIVTTVALASAATRVRIGWPEQGTSYALITFVLLCAVMLTAFHGLGRAGRPDPGPEVDGEPTAARQNV
ncbi:hypothetical protein [Micromonospora sp. NPDC051296]|uniref:hypothetical protein n=1 Tax=Micromonospora sp. NPDC051296 TaxID=3155046 RepID=UPI00342846F7